MLLAAVATLAGAAVQSATGFGFALLAAPAFLAAVGRQEAVATVLVLSLALNVLMLAGEGRRPEVLARPLATLLAAAVPGIIGGAFLLRALSKSLLKSIGIDEQIVISLDDHHPLARIELEQRNDDLAYDGPADVENSLTLNT